MDTLVRVRMSWEDYLALPEKPKSEWVDGVVVLNASPVPDHALAQSALAALLVPLFPWRVLGDTDVVLPRNRIRRPDLTVAAERPTGKRLSGPPLLCVEVLSPSTRSEDLLRKSVEYAEGGVGQYWVIDLDLPSVEVMRNVDGTWETVVVLDGRNPTAEVDLAGVVVPLDLRRIVP